SLAMASGGRSVRRIVPLATNVSIRSSSTRMKSASSEESSDFLAGSCSTMDSLSGRSLLPARAGLCTGIHVLDGGRQHAVAVFDRDRCQVAGVGHRRHAGSELLFGEI